MKKLFIFVAVLFVLMSQYAYAVDYYSSNGYHFYSPVEINESLIVTGDLTGLTTPITFEQGGTGISAWTQYLIPYADTTTSIGQIAIGDDGQVLTSGGAGVAPAFEAAAGGGATYREMTLLPQGAVLDDDNPAVIDVVESSGTGTPRFYRAKFDDGDSDAINYSFTMPSDYTASADVILDIIWYSDEDVAENVVWAVQVSASTPNADADIEAQACDTTDTVTDSADGNGAKAPLMATLTIDYANMDGAIAGDSIILRFSRLGADGSDTHTNECYMKEIHLKIPRS